MGQRDVRIPLRQRLRYIDRAANYERFLSQTRPQLLHVAHAEFRQFLSQQVARVAIPLVASVLSATVLLRPTPSWLVRMTTRNYNRATRLIACSHFVKSTIAPHVDDPNRVVVIPNGVDVDRFRPGSRRRAREALGLDSDAFVILYTGGLVRSKGVDLLLRAFAQGPAKRSGTRLVYVGAGPEAIALEGLAVELGVAQQVVLAGYRPGDELPSWYTACDVFALPSRSEGLSISVLEAMASGRPVVTTPPGIGDHDAVEEGVSGMLPAFGDVGALAAALSKFADSPERAVQMGIAARREVERRFSWPLIARQVADVYQEVLVEEEVV